MRHETSALTFHYLICFPSDIIFLQDWHTTEHVEVSGGAMNEAASKLPEYPVVMAMKGVVLSEE